VLPAPSNRLAHKTIHPSRLGWMRESINALLIQGDRRADKEVGTHGHNETGKEYLLLNGIWFHLKFKKAYCLRSSPTINQVSQNVIGRVGVCINLPSLLI